MSSHYVFIFMSTAQEFRVGYDLSVVQPTRIKKDLILICVPLQFIFPQFIYFKIKIDHQSVSIDPSINRKGNFFAISNKINLK